MIRQSHGIILATGPTGSGKSTTLYACLTRINSPEKNIITIEDPIEYQLRGVGQMQVNPKIDLTFASGLRSILRQDPDVIMVGEIRDSETAEIAIQAALTGHLVFSTLHTNDSFGAVTDWWTWESSRSSYRRRFSPCSHNAWSASFAPIAASRIRLEAKPSSRESVSSTSTRRAKICRPKGCRNCRTTGYRGRMAIQELMIMDDEIRSLVMQNADAATLRRAKCTSVGMTLLRQDGAARVLRGETSIEELLRVTQEDIE